VRPLWIEDLPQRSIGEVLDTKAQNIEWSKMLRRRLSLLVEDRLAKCISQEQYELARREYHQDTAECQRRRTQLENELTRRDKSWAAGVPG
jgi:hypothetical protein